MQLIVEDLRKRFGDKEVLKGASFTFEKGKIYGLLGRNGAGKTTMFNGLSGESELEGGTVWLEEDGVRRALGNSDIGYVHSLPILPEFLTGYEFIRFFVDVNQSRVRQDRSIDDYFDWIKLDREDRHRLIKGYSHGMKNKIQMLCFFITRPPVILLDEPLTSFDVVVALEIKKLLREMKEEHIIIFSTHILQLAADLCDELVLLNNGRLEPVSPEARQGEDFEERIIDLLKDERDV